MATQSYLFGFSRRKKAYWEKLRSIQGSNLIGLWRQNEVPAGNNYLTFNGSTTGVDAGSGVSLDNLHDAAFTVDGWFKTSDANEGVIICKGAVQSSTGGWGVYLTGSGVLSFRVCATTTSSTASSGDAVNDGTWHHFAVYFNDAAGADRKAYLAVDGVWKTAGALAVDAILTDAANNLKMGVLSTSAAWPLDGAIGWVRISNNDRLGFGVDFTGSIPSRTTIPTVDANTVSLWPMDEGYGSVAGDIGTNNNDGTISNGDWGAYPALTDSSPELNHGTYVGVNLANTEGPDGVAVPYYDGVNDVGNVGSAGLFADLNASEGTLLTWFKPSALADWDGGALKFIINFRDNAGTQHIYEMLKNSAANQFLWYVDIAGTAKSVIKSSVTATTWICTALTWSVSNDRVRAYWNGVQEGSDQTSLGTPSSPAFDLAIFGSVTAVGSSLWKGWIGPVAAWKVELTPAEILKASTI